MGKDRKAGQGGTGSWIPLALILFGITFLSACTVERKYRIMSAVFDGVPTPAERAAAKALADAKDTCACASDEKEQENLLVEEPVEVAAPEKPRPPIEEVATWEEVQEKLPKDVFRGVDWVKALLDGIIEPRTHLPSVEPPTEAPFTLDTIVPAWGKETTPPVDFNIDIVPDVAPFYKVVFPHSSHTLWLNCSSCHPGIAAQRGSGMARIFAGEYCGACHGKVSFSPMTSCGRCHVNLLPADEETIVTDLEQAHEEFPEVSDELLELGTATFLKVCAACHGEQGDGQGPLAGDLNPKPRDFTSGLYKFRSTNSSSVPTDYDMFRTITRGIPGTSMPSFSFLTVEERVGIVHFLKTLSDYFEYEAEEPIEISDPPEETPELLAEGARLFKEGGCTTCHGESGRGDGPSAAELMDDWGEPIQPFNFTSGRSPKGGSSLKDYYRDVMTGLQGTPMPDHGDIFEPEQAWAIVRYVYSLGEKNRGQEYSVRGDIHFERGEANSGAVMTVEDMPAAVFPHWFHRMRVRCSVCHPAIFQMKAGANVVTMDQIRAGKFCGTCHPSYPDDKSLAWSINFQSCMRCHVLP